MAVLLAMALASAACGTRGGGQAATTTSTSSPSGNAASLTASDVGVTPTTISISTLQDIGGPDPGLFETSKDAMVAFVDYINSQGGVDGRKLKLDPYDTQLSPTTFQIATQQSCQNDFAMVGSYSVGDNGGVTVGQQCGIPEVPAALTSPQAGLGSNVVSPLPTQPNVSSTGYPQWLKATYPSAITKGGILYPDNPVTRAAAARDVGTNESVGFHFLVDQVVALIQVDFTPFIIDMKNRGVQYFSWGADYQAMGRILQAMQQQSWHPQVFDGSAAGYTQAFLKAYGNLANGMVMALPIALFSEKSGNPAMQTYLTWLDKAVPNHAPPDLFGVTAWSAGLLFVKALKMVGPNPTRAKLLDALHSIHSWNGEGIQATSDPSSKTPTNCFVVVQVRGGQFVRVHPSAPNTFDCTGHLYTIPGIPPASASG